MKFQILHRLLWVIFALSILIPNMGHASFIESTMGTAVVNDATAAYNNPAALSLLKNTQIIGLDTRAEFHGQFTGQVTQPRSGFNQAGTSTSKSNYYLPSGYLGVPASDRFFLGLAVLANNFNRDLDQNSVLRYILSDNNIQAVDVVPAMAFKLTSYLSVGAGLNYSQANFLFTPITGFPSAPDTQTQNTADATAWGEDVGLLLTPSRATQIGFNYRGAMTYHFNGTSQLESNPAFTANNFSFDYWTPARYVLSINQFLSRSLGLIGTVQWIKWDIFDELHVKNIVTEIGANPIIIANATDPLHFHNAWVYTVGGYYRLSPKWIIRTAGSYVQSPGNPELQITEGDNIIIGSSIGYKLSKVFSIDASYAHAFIENQKITVQNATNTINGINKGYRDSVSLKLTANI